MSDILILHAPDATNQANELKAELEARRFEIQTFEEAMNRAPLGQAHISIHEHLVTNAPAIIVLASPLIFQDQLLIQIIEMAIMTRKFMPALIDFTGLDLPMWFSMYSSVNLTGVGERRDREFERLVRSLMTKL